MVVVIVLVFSLVQVFAFVQFEDAHDVRFKRVASKSGSEGLAALRSGFSGGGRYVALYKPSLEVKRGIE